MAFTPKNWIDSPSTSTPISAAALEDLETRVTDYADERTTVINVMEYGAAGDGVTDDQAAFMDAIAAADGGPIYLPPGDYHLTTRIYSTTGPINFIGAGCDQTVISWTEDTLENWPVSVEGTKSALANLSSNAAVGDYSLNVSTTGMAVGDYLLLSSTASWSAATAAKKGEMVRVGEITDATHVKLEGRILDSYTTATTAKVEKLNLIDGARFEGITFRQTATPSVGSNGLVFTHVKNVRIRDCRFENIAGSAIAFLYSGTDAVVEGCTFIDSNKDYDIAAGGYGVGFYDCWENALMHGCRQIGGDLMCSTGAAGDQPGVPRFITVSDCHLAHWQMIGFHTHEAGEYITFQGCTTDSEGYESADVDHKGRAFYLATRKSRLINCTANGAAWNGFWIQEAAEGALVQGCKAYRCGTEVTGQFNTGGISVLGDYVTVMDCYAEECYPYGIGTATPNTTDTTNLRIENCHVKGVVAGGDPTGYYGVYLDTSSATWLITNLVTEQTEYGFRNVQASQSRRVTGHVHVGNNPFYQDSNTMPTYLEAPRVVNVTNSVASTAALTLPYGHGPRVTVTGTASITSIGAVFDGQRVTLVFTGTAGTTGVVDGSNLKLAGNFVYTPDDTLDLVSDGNDWYEVGRSAN